MGNAIVKILSESNSIEQQAIDNLRTQVFTCDRSKWTSYKMCSPDLTVHSVYTRGLVSPIPEYLRIGFTRLRLSSHRLKKETGRWARPPREERLCASGAIQDEVHLQQCCPLSTDLHVKHNRPNLEFTSFTFNTIASSYCQYICDLLTLFE